MRTTVSIFALLALAGAASASTWVQGDIAVSTSAGEYRVYSNTGVLKDVLSNGGASYYTTGSAFDSTGNLWGTNFGGNSVSKFAGPGGTHTHSLVISGAGQTPECILFNAAGKVFLSGPGSFIARYSNTGVLEQTYSAYDSDWMDLASDQTTMFFGNEGGLIRRWDLASDSALPNFASTSTGRSYAMRLLADGSLLVAAERQVERFDALGNLIQTYDTAGMDSSFALNVDPDGTSFWTADFNNANVYKFDISTGQMLFSFNTGTGTNTVFGLSLFGERTSSGVPLPSAAFAGLAGMGMLASRRRRA